MPAAMSRSSGGAGSSPVAEESRASLGSEAAARDALADTYAKVVATIARYEWHPAGIYPWLRTIAFHVAMDALRLRKRETPFEVDDLERELDARSELRSVDVSYLQAEEASRAKAKIERAAHDGISTSH